ncbi:MAG: hypothetical protein WCY22_04420 [Acholeplasmataceae bacterium]
MHNIVFKILALFIAVLAAMVIYLLIDGLLQKPVFYLDPVLVIAIVILLGIVFLCLRSVFKKDI